MGLNFRKSINLGGGVKLNVGKKSIGISAGVKGARVSVNSKTGVKTTVSVPGTGASYTSTTKKPRKQPIETEQLSAFGAIIQLIKGIFSIVFYGFLLYLMIKLIKFIIFF